MDLRRCAAFLAWAEAALADLPNVRHLQNTYDLASYAAHDVGEAMLGAYGYRTRHGSGQHDALGRCLAAVFDTPPENAASRHFEQMRRDCNRQRYHAWPSRTVAAAAILAAAVDLHRAGTTCVRRGPAAVPEQCPSPSGTRKGLLVRAGTANGLENR